ncbi:acetylserotonin O-methyltransferase-like [Silene latifolia]|uniref:acetylserotonin O-methyltransferase-like n=1 Tax=Silene latifolia TaxID=37657 RepID=UPI003D788BC6
MSMEETKINVQPQNDHNKEEIDEEDAKAASKIWDYVFGFTDMALIKCAIDLGIPDLIEKNGGSISLSELSSSLSCSTPHLYRIMRYLVHKNIFNQKKTSQNNIFYSQTPLSRRLLSHGKNSMVPLLLLETSPTMLAPWLALSKRVLQENGSAFDAVHGEDVWSFAAENLELTKLMNDGMACDARIVIPRVIEECPDLFKGVRSVVDVGGGDGTTLSMLVKGFPWIKGINFDLPHVIDANLVPCQGVEHVSGDMFELVPKADVAIIKWVLHDWGDEECIKILKNCKEAIPIDKGKVIILEGVLEEETNDKLESARMMLDMVMMAHTTNGKERTLQEWNYVITEAGFSRINVTRIHAVQSVIEAFP